MGVLSVGAGAEVDGLVAGVKGDVEPGDEGMDIVIAVGGDREGDLEVQVLLLDGQDVNVLEPAGAGDDGFRINGVDKGLLEGDLLDRRVVKSVDVVPVCLLDKE